MSHFGEVAVHLGLITRESLQKALEGQEAIVAMGGAKPFLGEVLVRMGLLSAERLREVLRAQGKRVLGDYEVMATLGEGGMGTIFKARHLATNEVVAIKQLGEAAHLSEEDVQRFFREARALKGLKHKNIVWTGDVEEMEGRYYYTMEYVPGEDLGRTIKRQGAVPEDTALDIIRQIADALDFLNRHRIVHRDVKPSNILLRHDGVAKLTDFGILKRRGEEDASLTRKGDLLGTPYYISPEQVEELDDLDVRADIFALGATLYHLVCGQPPFSGKSLAAIYSKRLVEEPNPPQQLNPHVSQETVDLLRRMMARYREDRPSSPAVLIQEIDRILARRAAEQGPERPRPTRIALATSDPRVAQALARAVVGESPQLTEFHSLPAAVAACGEQRYDLLCFDVGPDPASAVLALAPVRFFAHPPMVVAVAGDLPPRAALSLFRNGVDDIVGRSADEAVLKDAFGLVYRDLRRARRRRDEEEAERRSEAAKAVAFELNQPLQAILLRAQAPDASRPVEDKDLRAALADVRGEAQHLAEILSRLERLYENTRRDRIELAQLSRPGHRPERGEEEGARILVVEGEPVVGSMLAHLLREQGYRVRQAATGAEARGAIGGEEFDLVVLDLVLPDESGLDIVRDLRDRLREAKVVVVTGHAWPDAVERGDVRVDAFIHKPFQAQTIAELIGELTA